MKHTPQSREEALALISKRQHNKEVGSEEILQRDCVRAFADKYPEKRGRLFATFQNPTPEQHNLWLAKGLVAGVSDLIYIDDEFRIVPIELKLEGKRHSADHLIRQANWILNNSHRGGFCTSVEMFFDIVENRSDGISCKFILSELEKKSMKSYIF